MEATTQMSNIIGDCESKKNNDIDNSEINIALNAWARHPPRFFTTCVSLNLDSAENTTGSLRMAVGWVLEGLLI